MKKNLTYILLFAFLSLWSGCKKDLPKLKEDDTEIKPPQTSKVYNTDLKENVIKDSVFYYTKLFSLWQDNLPPKDLNDLNKADLIRTKYTQYFERGEDVLDWLVSLTPKNSETGHPVDRYSFLDRQGIIRDEIQDAVATSFGMDVFYLQTESSGENADLYIRMVDQNSSAWNAGMERGDRIISINGNTKIDYNSQVAENFRTLNGFLNSNSLEVRFQKPSGTIMVEVVNSTQFEFNPVQDYRIISSNGKKIGYLAFSSFVTIEKLVDLGGGRKEWVKTPMYTAFENILGSLQGVDELVVDLRYNGGGAVITAEYLADWLVPSTKSQDLMYTTTMNTYFQREGWTRPGEEFGPVFFQKKGTINLQRIYFIVSKSTASASELLINVLKPHMSVYLVGTKAVNDANRVVDENTYGKPVGFWEWPIVEDIADSRNNVSLYASSFKTHNKAGEGDYFNGMKPNVNVWEFESFQNFGNPNESMLRAAISHINTGNFSSLALRSGGIIRKNRAIDERMEVRSNARGGMFKFNQGTLRLKE